MTKINTFKLTGAALDWAVAKCEGEYKPTAVPCYSTDWAQGGPIIEREEITLVCAEGEYSPKHRKYKTYWVAEEGLQYAQDVYGPQGDDWGACFRIENNISGQTPLIAAMRCYVASQLGAWVEIPSELT